MSASAAALRPSLRDPAIVDLRWVGVVVCSGAAVGMLATKTPLAGRMIAGLAVVLAYLIIALSNRKLALSMVFVWLAFVGLVRRALIPIVGWPKFDPLLLLGVACALILWVTTRKRTPRTALSTLAGLLLITALAQVLNPHSKDLQTGLLATLFWVGPLLWFFVGRSLTRAMLVHMFRLFTVLLVPVTIHGLLHSFGFFFPFEYTWVGVSGFGEAIFLANFKIRPFSSLTSPQEYGYFLSICLTILFARVLLEPKGRSWKVPLFMVGTVALFLQSSRGIFLFYLVMLFTTTSFASRHAGFKIVAVTIVTPFVVFAAMHSARVDQVVARPLAPHVSGVKALALHQIEGFTDPASSTLPLHRDLVLTALRKSSQQPLGAGLSEGTIAEIKTRNDRGPNPENDIATIFLALGLGGGAVFITFMLVATVEAMRRYRRRRDWVNLARVGLLAACLTQWWAGQMYAASAIFWLMLGTLARPLEEDDREPA